MSAYQYKTVQHIFIVWYDTSYYELHFIYIRSSDLSYFLLMAGLLQKQKSSEILNHNMQKTKTRMTLERPASFKWKEIFLLRPLTTKKIQTSILF